MLISPKKHSSWRLVTNSDLVVSINSNSLATLTLYLLKRSALTALIYLSLLHTATRKARTFFNITSAKESNTSFFLTSLLTCSSYILRSLFSFDLSAVERSELLRSDCFSCRTGVYYAEVFAGLEWKDPAFPKPPVPRIRLLNYFIVRHWRVVSRWHNLSSLLQSSVRAEAERSIPHDRQSVMMLLGSRCSSVRGNNNGRTVWQWMNSSSRALR